MLSLIKYFHSVVSNANISVAKASDIPELVRLINSAYRNSDSVKGWTNEAELFEGSRATHDSLKYLLDQPQSAILKYSKDNKIVGSVYLQKNRSQMYLGVLAVSPEFQDRGIGRELLAAAEEYASKHNCNRIMMTVISIRRELVDWYKRRGYRETGEVNPFPDDKVNRPKQPLELLVLEKEIDN